MDPLPHRLDLGCSILVWFGKLCFGPTLNGDKLSVAVFPEVLEQVPSDATFTDLDHVYKGGKENPHESMVLRKTLQKYASFSIPSK